MRTRTHTCCPRNAKRKAASSPLTGEKILWFLASGGERKHSSSYSLRDCKLRRRSRRGRRVTSVGRLCPHTHTLYKRRSAACAVRARRCDRKHVRTLVIQVPRTLQRRMGSCVDVRSACIRIFALNCIQGPLDQPTFRFRTRSLSRPLVSPVLSCIGWPASRPEMA